jgi:hypothetical protein
MSRHDRHAESMALFTQAIASHTFAAISKANYP